MTARLLGWLDVADLLAEKEPDLDDVAIAVVNDLADLGERVVLVIDDFQFAAAYTVKTHVKRIYIKLGVSSRTEAITEARRLGVL